MNFKKIFTKEAKIGLLVVVSIGLLYFGVNYLKGVNIFKPDKYFYAQYNRIDGIVKTSQVMINGYKVGHISNIYFDYTKEAPITLEITVDKDLVVPKGTIAQIYETGMLGDKAIQLILSNSSEVHAIGDTLQSETSQGLVGEIVGSLMPPIQRLVPQIDSTLYALRKLLENGSIEKSLNNIESTTTQLEGMSKSLKKIVNNDVPVISSDVSTITKNLNKVSSDLSKTDFYATMQTLNQTLDNLKLASNKLNQNDNTMGLLLNDKSLYLNLNSTMDNANKLVIDLKENPKRYVHFSVFGKKTK